MEIGPSNGVISNLVNNASAKDQLNTAVLKKALDIQAQQAAQLVSALPEPETPKAQDPSATLGRHIDVRA